LDAIILNLKKYISNLMKILAIKYKNLKIWGAPLKNLTGPTCSVKQHDEVTVYGGGLIYPAC